MIICMLTATLLHHLQWTIIQNILGAHIKGIPSTGNSDVWQFLVSTAQQHKSQTKTVRYKHKRQVTIKKLLSQLSSDENIGHGTNTDNILLKMKP